MSNLPERILWKAVDGREFIIEPNKLGLKSMNEVYAHIADLRKKHGYNEPTFMHAAAAPNIDVGDAIDVDELPGELREEVKKVIVEGMNKPDPKKLN